MSPPSIPDRDPTLSGGDGSLTIAATMQDSAGDVDQFYAKKGIIKKR